MNTAYINIKNDEVTPLLAKLQSKLRDLTPVLQDMGAHMEMSIQANFDAEGRPEKWKPLNLRYRFWTIARRKTYYNRKTGRFTKRGLAAYFGRKILTDTGRLRNSIHYQVDKNTLRIYTNVIYAAVHQFGYKNIPKRPFLLVQDEDWRYFKVRLSELLEVLP